MKPATARKGTWPIRPALLSTPLISMHPTHHSFSSSYLFSRVLVAGVVTGALRVYVFFVIVSSADMVDKLM